MSTAPNTVLSAYPTYLSYIFPFLIPTAMFPLSILLCGNDINPSRHTAYSASSMKPSLILCPHS